MAYIRWKISAGAVLLLALAYFFDESGLFAAVVPAVLVHEAGHAAVLTVFGARLRRVEIDVFGLRIDYSGAINGLRLAAAAAAGPAAGIVYAVAAFSAAGEFWRMSGAASFLLSAFNMLPALPLDGGRLASAALGDRPARRLSRAASVALTAGGALILLRWGYPGALAAGCWLSVYNFT